MTQYRVEWWWSTNDRTGERVFETLRLAWCCFWRSTRRHGVREVWLQMEPHPYRPWEPYLPLVEWHSEDCPSVEFGLAEPGLEWWHYGKPWGDWYGEGKGWSVYVKEERRLIESAPKIESVKEQPWEPLEYPACPQHKQEVR